MTAFLEKLCAMCHQPIPDRPHQDARTVRCCSASCAGALARRENPEPWMPREVPQ